MQMTEYPVFSRRADVQVRELDGEAFVYDPRTADTHRLNDTALFIWKQCDGEQSVRDVIDAVTEHYDVGIAEACDHVARVIREFEQKGLIISEA